MKCRSHRDGIMGFSLVELLAVIAIISIMAALLVPGVRGAIVRGQAVAVGNDGRQWWLGLYTENSDRYRRGEEAVWPADGTYENSTTFFKDCIASNWLDDKFTFKPMAAPGIAAANTDDPDRFSERNNAWCLVLGCGDSTKGETPFMFTRNLVAADNGDKLLDIDSFDPGAKPFGNDIGVIITFGGAVKTVRGRDAEAGMQLLFNPMGASNAFVRP